MRRIFVVWEGNRWGNQWRVIDESGLDVSGKGATTLKTIKHEAPVKTFKKVTDNTSKIPPIVKHLMEWSKYNTWYYDVA